MNWKTTLAGILTGAVYAATNQTDWKHLLMAFLFALVGLLAKDFNVTGGTVAQNGGTVPVVKQ